MGLCLSFCRLGPTYGYDNLAGRHQRASTTVVPGVPWDARGYLIIAQNVHLSAVLSGTNPMCNGMAEYI
eukprot:scaffold54221_cov55-Phaeocystis_antarctica.AAC.10